MKIVATGLNAGIFTVVIIVGVIVILFWLLKLLVWLLPAIIIVAGAAYLFKYLNKKK